ncbi:hypothetical protein ACFX1T_047012 [Malus domestica]
MARFSLGGDEDGEGEGSRSPRHKRPRLNGLNSRRFNASTSASTTTRIVQPPPPPPEPPQQLQIVEEEDERVSAEEDDSESENDVEEDDDEESPGNEDADTGDSDESDEEEEAAEITILPQSPPRIPRRLLVRSLAQYLARDNDRQVGSASGSLASTATAAGVQEAPPSISPAPAPATANATAIDASVVFTLTDSDVLDCFICCEPLTVPVYQCENGHIACSSCCTKSKNKCPTCSWPIGYNRCRAIENVLEAIRVSCQNIKHGCKESMTYNKKNEHEKACIFSPCSCPQSGCNFVSPSKQLYQHFSSNHVNSAYRFRYNCVFSITLFHREKSHTLQEQNDGTLFILDNVEESLGNIVSISCIQPSFMGGFYYDLLARTKNGKGSSLRLQSFAKSIPGQVSNPSSTDHLIIPCGFFENGGSLKMDLRIWHKGKPPLKLTMA